MNQKDFFESLEGVTEKAHKQTTFSFYGKNVCLRTNCSEVENEVLKDLKAFSSSAGTCDFTVYGVFTEELSSELSKPPLGSILVWKSPDYTQSHYLVDGKVVAYHKQDDSVVAVVAESRDGSIVCVSRNIDTLYELSSFQMEKKTAGLLSDQGLQLIHASSIQMDGKGLIFPATSGFGKTFIALVLIDKGHKILADDTTFIDPESLLLHPHVRRLRVDRRSLDLFPNLKSYLDSIPHRFLNKEKYLVDVDKAWPNSFADQAKLDYIVFPTIWVESSSKLMPCKTEYTLQRLLVTMRLFNEENTAKEKRIAFDLATRVPSYHLLMGTDISGIERAIRNTLEL